MDNVNVMCKERVKRFEVLFNKAKGDKTVGRFSDECGINPKYMCQLLRNKASVFPNKDLLKNIAKNSNGTVTYNELLHVCGYKLIELQKFNFRKGDIFNIALGEGVGSEQEGSRPCVVIQNNKGNLHSPTLIAAPLTTQFKVKLPTHVTVDQSCGLNKTSTCMLEQMRVVDKQRVTEYIGHCDSKTISNINRACKIELQIDDQFNFEYAKYLLVQMITVKNLKNDYDYDHRIYHLERGVKYNFLRYCKDHNKDYRLVKNSILNSLEIKENKKININQYELQFA